MSDRPASFEPKDWVEIESLLHDVLEQGHHDPATYLLEHHAEQSHLHGAVIELVRGLEEPPTLLSRNCLFDQAETDLRVYQKGHLIGRYELIELIGRGGMGQVYRARRAEVDFEQEVALKLLELPSPRLAERFRQERQILASLAHRNIARLLDGGLTEDGTPFLAMEFVDGCNLLAYCDQQRLSIEQRLDLFQSVCDAVAFAHRNLIIHRDLKPSNIWVADDGQVKLLDFGIAKILSTEPIPGAAVERENSATDSARLPTDGYKTVTHHLELTPAWAAPEQLLLTPVTTATDVYSLGMVLYQLLCGSRPYMTDGLTPAELEEVICSAPITLPSKAKISSAAARSRGVVVSQLRRSLRGNLDALVQKALQKQPQDRYPSVDALLRDLRAHRERFPVSAREPSWAVRSWSFVRRNAVASTAAVLIALALSLGLLAALQGRAQAQLQAGKSEAVADLLIELIGIASPDETHGGQFDIRRLLREGVLRLETELETSPEIRSELYRVLGVGHFNFGEYEQARRLLQKSLELGGLDGKRGPGSRIALLTALGDLDRQTANHQDAERSYLEALALTRELQAPNAPRATQIRADVINGLGILRTQQGLHEDAVSSFEESLRLKRSLAPSRSVTLELAETLNNLGVVETDLEDLESAESFLRESLALQEGVVEPPISLIATTLSSLAAVLRQRGDLEAAEPLYYRVLQLRRELFGPEHPSVAQSINNLGSLYFSQGKPDLAAESFEQAYQIWKRTQPENHPDLSAVLMNLSTLRERAGDYDAAIAGFREALEMRSARLRPDHPELGYARYRVAKAELGSGNPEAALRFARPARNALRDSLGAKHVRTIRAQALLTSALAAIGSCSEAAAEFTDLEPSTHPGAQFTLPEDSPCHAQLRSLISDAGPTVR